ncbi:MAG: GTP-binding protein [Eubacterium sp.]|nr:GTP-binding protein [Eubacterium sp.]
MVKVDLITGFLGSGKTTFILKYADYLRRAGQKFFIIENEFGPVSVDTAILKDAWSNKKVGVSTDAAAITEAETNSPAGSMEIRDLTGTCMCCSGFEKFRTLLLEGARCGCDRILVEPSGIYDVDEFFHMMQLDSIREQCEIGSVLTVVSPEPCAVSDETAYLMFSQLLAAGHVLISKTQLFPEEQTAETVTEMNRILTERGAEPLPPELITQSPWDALTDADLEALTRAGFRVVPHNREISQHEMLFSTSLLSVRGAEPERMEPLLKNVFHDALHFGTVLRIKGFVRGTDRTWYEINATPGVTSVRPGNVSRGLLVCIGQNLNEPAVRSAFQNEAGMNVQIS